MSGNRDPEEAVRRQMARQYGVITSAQALTAGLSRRQIDYRVSVGHWDRLAHGIYRLAAAPVSDQQRAQALLLGAPPGSRLSFETAAWLLGMRRAPTRHIVTIPPTASMRLGIGTAHRGVLVAGDRAMAQGLAVTSPARTVVDCAATLSLPALAELADKAIVGGLTTARHIVAASQRIGAHRGVARLRTVMEHWAGPVMHDSVPEAWLLRGIREWGMPDAMPQYEVHDHDGIFVARLDLAFPDYRIGLEYDGGLWHPPRRLAHDLDRMRKLEALGWDIGHVDRSDLRPGSDIRARVERLLADAIARGAGPAARNASAS